MGIAAAEEHGSGHAPGPGIWWKWANFAVLAAALGYLIRKYAPAFFRSQDENIRRALEEAARLKKEAEERAAGIERRMMNLQAEIDELRRTARQEVAAEGERVRQETGQQLEKVQALAEQEIAAAGIAARQQLKAYAAGLAIELAERRLRGEITPEADRRIVSGFLKGLQ